jgi:hypothetical protein
MRDHFLLDTSGGTAAYRVNVAAVGGTTGVSENERASPR